MPAANTCYPLMPAPKQKRLCLVSFRGVGQACRAGSRRVPYAAHDYGEALGEPWPSEGVNAKHDGPSCGDLRHFSAHSRHKAIL